MRGDEFYLHAFWELSTCRSFGAAIGPIPWHHIVDYGERAGLEPAMVRVLVDVMRSLDEVYLDWQKKENNRNIEVAPEPGKVKKRDLDQP